MTTATATAPEGTKGRRITVTYDDGRELTRTQKHGRFVTIVSDDHYGGGADYWTSTSGTAKGAAALVAGEVSAGISSNVRVIEVTDPSTDRQETP